MTKGVIYSTITGSEGIKSILYLRLITGHPCAVAFVSGSEHKEVCAPGQIAHIDTRGSTAPDSGFYPSPHSVVNRAIGLPNFGNKHFNLPDAWQITGFEHITGTIAAETSPFSSLQSTHLRH